MSIIFNINPLPTLPPRGKESIIPPCGTEKGVKNLLIIIFLFLSYNSYSQTNCTVPSAPVLKLVSVRPETGITEFTWTPSQSTGIAAYIIYSYKDGVGMPIDTVWNPSATNYSFSSSSTKYFSVSYVIAAHRLSGTPGMPGCTSPLSNALTTVFAAADIDTCNNRINVAWNSYSPFPENVTDYSILVSLNGGPYTEAGKASSGENHFYFKGFTTDYNYCFVIKTNLEGGSYSTSNKSCLNTKMQRPPNWINADYATVTDDKRISLSFFIDPLSQINRFILEKKTGISGTFHQISQPSSVNGKILYIDNQADINSINYYRASAINNCNIPITISNISSNIVLSLEKRGDDINLSWNVYKKWAGIISAYQLFINTGKGYEEKTVISASDSAMILGYRDIMYAVSGNEVCFYISASEASNPYNVNGNSRSSEVCISPTEIITVPNVFTPDNDLLNDYFRPVLSFTPADYHLIISDMQGNVLFESRDHNEEWDGSQNGKPQPQGVCLWFLKVKTPSGNIISKTGTLTIIHNR